MYEHIGHNLPNRFVYDNPVRYEGQIVVQYWVSAVRSRDNTIRQKEVYQENSHVDYDQGKGSVEIAIR